jgi:hypothetical protein
MMKKVVTMLAVMMMAVVAFEAGAQPNRKGINWMMKEKIKVDPEMAIRHYFQQSGQEIPESVKGSLKYTDKPIHSSTNIDAEVHAAVNPTDSQNILASPIRQGFGALSTPIYYTKNFGGSWTKSNFNPMPAQSGAIPVGGGDPVLAFDKNGRAYFTWLELHIRNAATDTIYWGLYWAYSDDGGVTWIRPDASAISLAKVETAGFTSDRPVTDKQWIATDRSNSIHQNNLYMSYVEIDLTNGTYQILIHTKPADSLSFNPSAVAITDSTFTLAQFASLDVDVNGHVHVSFFGTKDNSTYGIYHSKSTDGGATFSAPVLVTPTQLPGFSAGQLSDTIPGMNKDRLYPSCYLAANMVTSDIYITWTANGLTSKLSKGLDIYFTSSADGGATWSTPKVVNDDLVSSDAHQYYSSISCGPDGNVVMGWYDRRDDTLNMVAHYYFTESFDHGATFTQSYQVTSTGTNFSKVGLSNNNFGIGEYTQVLALKDHIIPVWTDGRTNNGNLNIYVAFVNRKTMSLEQLTGVNHSLGIINLYPNPAKEHITVELSVNEPSSVEIFLIDMTGRIASTLHQGLLSAGTHSLTGDTRSLSAGTYYLMVRNGHEHFTRKVLLVN